MKPVARGVALPLRPHPSRPHPLRPNALASWIAGALLLLACEDKEPHTTAPRVSPAVAQTSASPLVADRRIQIPAGTLIAGTVPGTLSRVPELEPAPSEVRLGEYSIDKLPYPNDPSQAPLLGASRERATVLCSQAGGRLCTELEWERACKGPNNQVFASGESWGVPCSEGSGCASGFDVMGLGTRPEWTSSDVIPTDAQGQRRPALRGAAPEAPADLHRCAHRTAHGLKDKEDGIGFRCCYAPPNSARVTEPTAGPTFSKTVLTAERLTELMKQHPQTAPYSQDLVFFKDPEAAETVVARGPGARQGFSFGVAPMLWNPVAGATFLVVSARSGKDISFVLVFHKVDNDTYSLAASFVMKNEPGPVAFAYSSDIRPRFHFSTCWGCLGETGKVLYRKGDRVSILQP